MGVSHPSARCGSGGVGVIIARLHYRDNQKSDKLYYIHVVGNCKCRDNYCRDNYQVCVEYGRRGRELNALVKEHNLSRQEALNLAHRIEREQRAQGYQDFKGCIHCHCAGGCQ